jgi:tryptophan-rich sensory protein
MQLAANTLWSWLFFAWQQGLWSFVDIALLWCLIIATVVTFWRVRILAGILLLPYLAWVTFAAVLNFAIWRLNPEILAEAVDRPRILFDLLSA